jgi:hypothetical protein
LVIGTAFATAPSTHAAKRGEKADPPFVGTLEDGAQINAFFEKRDHSWYVHKRFISRIVERVLVSRGFEAKSAAYVAANWDAWRYHPETGDLLYSGRAPRMTSSAAVTFANALPECLKDLGKGHCRPIFSAELGCRHQPPLVDVCEGTLRRLNRVFESLFDPRPRSDPLEGRPYPFNQHTFYVATCNFNWGGKGAALAVFAPLSKPGVTKLVFDATRRANSLPIQSSAPSESKRPRPAPKVCSEYGITETAYDGKFGGAAIPIKGPFSDTSGEGAIEPMEYFDKAFEDWRIVSARNTPKSIIDVARAAGIAVPHTDLRIIGRCGDLGLAPGTSGVSGRYLPTNPEFKGSEVVLQERPDGFMHFQISLERNKRNWRVASNTGKRRAGEWLFDGQEMGNKYGDCSISIMPESSGKSISIRTIGNSTCARCGDPAFGAGFPHGITFERE